MGVDLMFLCPEVKTESLMQPLYEETESMWFAQPSHMVINKVMRDMLMGALPADNVSCTARTLKIKIHQVLGFYRA